MAIRPYRTFIVPIWRRGATKGGVTLSAVVDDLTSAVTGFVVDVADGTEGTITVRTLGVTVSATLDRTARSQTVNLPRDAGIVWGKFEDRETPLKDGKPLGASFKWVNPDGVMNTAQRAVREAEREATRIVR